MQADPNKPNKAIFVFIGACCLYGSVAPWKQDNKGEAVRQSVERARAIWDEVLRRDDEDGKG